MIFIRKVSKITVIAAGNGGITAAADLKEKGFDVTLYDLPEKEHKLEAIREQNGITINYNNKNRFISDINCSTDIYEAVKDADVVMFTLPGLLVEKYAEFVAPAVKEDQLVFFNSAASMSSIRFINKARDLGLEKNYFLAEANSLTYATRADHKKASANISLKVKETLVAALPKERTEDACSMIAQLYDGIIPVENIWRITLENANPEVHPGMCLLNIGQLENDPGFSVYRDGYTKSTINLLLAIADERRKIAKAFGFELEDVVESRINRGYFSDYRQDLHLMFNQSPVFSKINGPNTIHSRYIVEDIEDGLVLWSDLGKLTNTPTPIIDSVINIGSVVVGIDFRKNGLSLEKLRLDNLDLNELINMV